MADTTASSSTQRLSESSTHAPSQAEIHSSVTRLLNNLRMTAASDCPEHKDRTFCPCPAALRRVIDGTEYLKRDNFLCAWECHLLMRPCVWDYDGSQQSHHAFTTAHGDTPKHFARQFIQSHESFAPAKKQADLVQAMLEVWILRNKQWRERYRSRKGAQKLWMKDEYPDLYKPEQEEKVPWCNLDTDLEKAIKAGESRGMMKFFDLTIGPPWHRCTMTLYYHGRFEAGVTSDKKGLVTGTGEIVTAAEIVRVHEIRLCHEECDVGRKLMADFVTQAARQFIVILGREPKELLILHPEEGLESIEIKKKS